MPNTSGVNAIGIWMIACIVMVFGAITEYGIILYITFNKRTLAKIINNKATPCNHKDDCSKRGITTHGSTDNEKIFVVSQNTTGCKTEKRVQEDEQSNSNDNTHYMKLKMIDAVSLFMFPTAFLLFIVVYCVSFQT